MTVEEFDTQKGLFVFRFDNLETEFHHHPAIEIIQAENGTFTLWTENGEYQGLKFAVIEANQRHKLSSAACALKVIMIEHHKKIITDIMGLKGVHSENGFYFQIERGDEEDTIHEIVQKIRGVDLVPPYDQRIVSAINYINNNDLEYSQMIKTLQKVTNLSESRLSHLFKSNIGISLKRYLVWAKLKSTIRDHLNGQEDLFSSLIKSGFYDQPHFSRTFKSMLGVKASKAYNSRTVQVLANLRP